MKNRTELDQTSFLRFPALSLFCLLRHNFLDIKSDHDRCSIPFTFKIIIQKTTQNVVFTQGKELAIINKCAGHMRTANAQISLRGCASWSGPSLSANKIIGYYRMYKWRAKTRMILRACAEGCVSAHFAQSQIHIIAWRGPIYKAVDI